jgi:DNA-directed RNA polymerase subunit F
MKWLLFILSFAVGAYLGSLLVSDEEEAPVEEGSFVGEQKKSRYRSYSPTSHEVSRYLASHSHTLDQVDSFKDLTMQLAEEKQSPVRMRSILGMRAQQLSKDELLEKVREGEIITMREFEEVARHLTEMDPDAVFDLYETHTGRFRSLDNSYAFYNAMLDTWIPKDAESLMKRIQGLPRGGSQQDISLRFSQRWARHDPEAAAEHFDDLVYLRNMQIRGDVALSPSSEQYATILLRSWKRKDREGLVNYLDQMDEGKRKDLFLSVWQKLNK